MTLLELKRAPRTCCPEPSCDVVRDRDIFCESCGASCVDCPIRPPQRCQGDAVTPDECARWSREILRTCEDVAVIDQGLARCRIARRSGTYCGPEECPRLRASQNIYSTQKGDRL